MVAQARDQFRTRTAMRGRQTAGAFPPIGFCQAEHDFMSLFLATLGDFDVLSVSFKVGVIRSW